MNSIVGQADRFWLYAISLPVTINSGDAVGRYTGIRFCLCLSKYLSTFLICDAVLPYQETDNILETFYESVLGNVKRYFHQTSRTV